MAELLRAVRDNPVAAQLAGINVGRLKVNAFAISSGVAGLSGGLLVMLISGVSPSAFPLSLSFSLLAGAVVTGLYSLKGVMLGGLVLVAIPEIADSLVSRIGGSEGFTTVLPGFLGECAADLGSGVHAKRSRASTQRSITKLYQFYQVSKP